jgi:DNA polymerase III delta subunit
MVEKLAYLFIGDDEAEKKKKIEEIKERYLDKGLKDIDFSLVYADDKDLTPQKFDETLSYLPSSQSKKRIVVIKNLESLRQENKEVLLKRLKNPCGSVIFLLDASSSLIADAFIKELSPFTKKVEVSRKEKIDAFKLAEAIISHKTTYALGILSKLLQKREKPQSILGALFWQWDKAKDKLSIEQFKQGLKLLLDTDSRIKTGRLDEELALELVVIRLSYLA